MISAYPSVEDLSGAVWIDLKSPSEDDVAQAEIATGLRIPTREDISEIEATSRLQRHGASLYLSTPLLSTAEVPRLSPVGFVLTDERLITVRYDAFGAFDAAEAIAETDSEMTAAGVFTCLFESIIDRLADALESAAAELDHVSRSIFHGRPHRRRRADKAELYQRQVLSKVGRIGERLSDIRDVLLGVGRIVPFVLEVRNGRLSEAISARLKAVRQDIASLTDYEAHLAGKVQFLLDAVLGFITISQNDIFKVLTVASAVGIPPTIMAGVYGMNFKYMPELNWTLGYPFGLAAIVVSALIPLAIFKWKGWV